MLKFSGGQDYRFKRQGQHGSSGLMGHVTTGAISNRHYKADFTATTDLGVHAAGHRRRAYAMICPTGKSARVMHDWCPAPRKKTFRLAIC
jgi:hypothetical protein